MSSTKPRAKLEEDSDDFDIDIDSKEFSFSDLYTSAGKHVADLQEKLKEDRLKKLHEFPDEDKHDPQTSPTPIKIPKSSVNCDLTSILLGSSSNPTEPEIIAPIQNGVSKQVGRVTRSRATRGRGRARGRAGRGRRNGDAAPDEGRTSSEDDERLPAEGRKSSRRVRCRGSGTRKSTPIKLLPRPNIFTNGTIEVSDDSEQDISFLAEEDPNWEVSVKVFWKFKDIHKFKIRKFQKFTTIFEFFSQMENVPQDQVQLMLNDHIIQPSDTPDSLQLSIANIIDGEVIKPRAAESVSNVRPHSPVDKDLIQLKVCTKDSKEPILIKLRKTEKMRVLMSKVSEEIEKPVEKLRFSFDGETLNPNETPEDLDLEGGEMIDLRILPS